MGIKVAKFGGSSVADAIQINKIKDIINEDDDIRYVVVSAPGKRFSEDTKVTDLLYLCRTHIEHKLAYEQIFQVICDRYLSMESSLGVDVDMKEELEQIRRNINAETSVDYIASRGEYLNAKLIAAYLGFEFVDAARVVKFSDKGKFMSAHFPGCDIYVPMAGLVDVEKEKERIANELKSVEKDLSKHQAKLDNEKFMSKAPEEIKQKEINIVKELTETAAKLKERLASL